MNRVAAVMLGALAMFGVVGCGSDDDPASNESGAAAKTRSVKVAMNFQVQPQHAPFFYAKEKGYFSDEGLEVEILPTQGSDQAMNLLNAGQVDFALSDFDTYVTQKADGSTKAQAVYVYLDQSTLGIVTTEPVSAPEDLEGKTFSTTASSAGRKTVPFVLEQNGADSSKMGFEALDFSVLYPSLFQGKVDAAEIHSPGSWRNLEETAEKQGRDVYLTLMSEWGLETYEKVLLAGDKVLGDREAVAGFVSALNKGLTESLASASDEEMVALVKEFQPTATDTALAADWNDYKDRVESPGPFDPDQVEQTLKTLNDVGAIAEIPADADALYTNEYLEN